MSWRKRSWRNTSCRTRNGDSPRGITRPWCGRTPATAARKNRGTLRQPLLRQLVARQEQYNRHCYAGPTAQWTTRCQRTHPTRRRRSRRRAMSSKTALRLKRGMRHPILRQPVARQGQHCRHCDAELAARRAAHRQMTHQTRQRRSGPRALSSKTAPRRQRGMRQPLLRQPLLRQLVARQEQNGSHCGAELDARRTAHRQMAHQIQQRISGLRALSSKTAIRRRRGIRQPLLRRPISRQPIR